MEAARLPRQCPFNMGPETGGGGLSRVPVQVLVEQISIYRPETECRGLVAQTAMVCGREEKTKP